MVPIVTSILVGLAAKVGIGIAASLAKRAIEAVRTPEPAKRTFAAELDARTKRPASAVAPAAGDVARVRLALDDGARAGVLAASTARARPSEGAASTRLRSLS